MRYHANNTKCKSYLMSFTIRLLIWFKSRLVGQDSFGNRYYEERADKVPAGNRQGLSIKGIMKQVKFLLSGMHGCIIERSSHYMVKCMLGKNRISLTLQAHL